MNKVFLYVFVVAVLLLGGFMWLNNYIYTEKQGDQKPALTPKDATYVIGGQVVTLTNGVSEVEAAPGSASNIVTKYFGNEVTLDLDNDGRQDTVFLLTQNQGGSGTFYYVVAALNKEAGYEGSQGLLLGDRIAPQSTEVSQNPNHKQVVVVNYADRKPNEPMTATPSVSKSLWLKLDVTSMQFGEVAQNFEGEADAKKMSLTMKPWAWVSALYGDGREVTPRAGKEFVLTFGTDGRFTAKTDCNSVAGSYVADGEALVFGEMISTKMYCEGSQEETFTQLLSTTSHYHFTNKGELILDLKFDSGSAVFK